MSIPREVLLRLGRTSGTALLVAIRGATAALIIGAFLLPANAQFWGDSWGGRQQPQQRQQPYTPFGGFGGDRPGGLWGDRQPESPRYYPRQRERVREPEREEPPDYSHAPPATPRKDATIKIVVMGDANADWLAYGLEDAFSEKPEIGIVRKHRTDSGLIRYDQRRDREWPQIAREIITAEKPKYLVMMVGNNDRQAIREKVSTAAPSAAPKVSGPQPAKASPSASDPEQQPPEPPQGAEHANMTEQARRASLGPWDFHTDKWELAYIRRIDATIAAFKSVGVPVIWVGLPSQRGPKASADSAYLNELYRSRAEKAGIVYVDVWEGFVDEAGKFSPQGPDYLGQIRRLRTGDGIHFTKFGARKLALYVEREIERSLSRVPVALPIPADQTSRTTNGKPSAPVRPEAGSVVPLTMPSGGSEKVLLGGPTERLPAAADPTTARVLTTGQAIPPTTGRADDFRWQPRSDITTDGAKVAPAPKE
jgi:hypothetical protein